MKLKKIFLAVIMAVLLVTLASCGETPAKYNVTFNVNGGTPEIAAVETEGTVTKPSDPTKTGFDFGGWYTDAACTDGNEFTFASDKVTEDTTLYAKWTQVKFTVTFNITAPTGVTAPTVAPVEVATGGKVSKPTVTGLDSKYDVLWYSDEARTVAANWNNTITANVTIYGKVIVKIYNIPVFYLLDGEVVDKTYNALFVDVADLVVEHGANIVAAYEALHNEAPEIAGIDFIGYGNTSENPDLAENFPATLIAELYLVYETPEAALDYANAKSVNISDLSDDKISASVVADIEIDEFFTLVASSDKPVEINAHVHSSDDGLFAFTKRFNLKGAIDTTTYARSVKITASGPGKIIAYMKSSSSGVVRNSLLLAEDGSKIIGDGDLKGDSTANKVEIIVPASGIYYLGSASGSAYVYYVQFIPYIVE